MQIVQLEHAIKDFATWKAAFDRDPIRRQASGVRSYRIVRPVEDPLYVAVDLDFDTHDDAVAFTEALKDLWQSPQAAPALGGTPRVRIVEAVETHAY